MSSGSSNAASWGQWMQAKLAPLQAAQEQAFAALTAEIQQSHDQLKNNLAAHGFDPPNDLEEWERLERLRKAISKLRAASEEGGAADHVLIVRGGSQSDPEYTLVLRFGTDDE